jgi:uncharacterized iron-regulated protein
MKLIAVITLTINLLTLQAQDKKAYTIYTGNGKECTWSTLMKEAWKSDMIFFGEYHDCPVVHWLQYELTKEMSDSLGKKVILGAEMFESDNQVIINEYTQGMLPAAKFEAEARLWPNYKTDYKPLVDIAVSHKLIFVATNTPRRYASMVAQKGFEILDSLSTEAKSFIAPLPIIFDENLACYKSMLSMGQMGKGPTGKNLAKAQALKDATMAHFILKYWTPGTKFIHYNGAYHSDSHLGIVHYIQLKEKKASIMVISCAYSDDLSWSEEYKGTGDFVIVVNSNMTRTH